MHYKKNIVTFLVFLFFSSIIYFLIIKQIIYPTIIPMIKNGVINIFVDWRVILHANICHEKGFDTYINNPCSPWNGKHVYGQILLYIPFITNFPNFYFIYLPIILNLIFLYTVINFFKYENTIGYICLFLIVFSAPIILAIERANIDIAIFLLLILISKNKNILINYLILILTTISKFYPICMAIIFLFKKKIKIITINIIFFLLIIFLILFFQLESLIKIFDNRNQFTGSGIYNFSFGGLLNFLLNFKIIYNSKSYDFIKYLILISLLITPIFLVISLNLKKIFNNHSILNLFNEDIFENRVYILSSAVVLFCFFSFSNFFYREIFFVGLIPWLLKNRHLNESKFINLYFYILISKFFISTVLVFLVMNNVFQNFNILMVFTKYCLDFYLIIIVLIVFLISIRNFLSLRFKNT